MKYLLLLLMMCFAACTNGKQQDQLIQEKFDRAKWSTKEGQDYPYRDKMLKDLMTNYELHDLKNDSLLGLIGSPDKRDSSYLFYRITQQRFGSFIIHEKLLVVKLTADSTVEWRKIHE